MNNRAKTEPICVICGRPLKNPESIERGMGDICASKYASFTHKESKKAKYGAFSNTPKYSYRIIHIGNRRVGVVIDESDGCACPSVTNAVEMVAKEIGVEHIVYRDTMGNWDYWDKKGFAPLAQNGKPTKDMDKAIEVAKERYFHHKERSLF